MELPKTLYKCPKCPFETQWNFAFSNHQQRHLQETSSLHTSDCFHKNYVYSCNVCDFKTALKVLLHKHVAEHRLETLIISRGENWIEEEVVDIKPEVLEYNPNQYRCTHCGLETFSEFVLVTHLKSCLFRNVALSQCKNRNLWFECDYRSIVDFYFEQHSNVWFDCTKYDYKSKSQFVKIYCFYNHALKKHPKWLKCSLCDYKTTIKQNYKYHQTYHHTPINEIERFQCKFCNYETKWKHCLNAHWLSKHSSKTKMFKCLNCDYKTPVKRYLKKHYLYNHNNNELKWFKCNCCDYKSKTKQHLNHHQIRKHLSAQSIRWFECDQCAFKAKTKDYLKRHQIKKHIVQIKGEKFICSKCGCQTVSKYNIRKHEIEEKISDWFKCVNCDFQTKILSCFNYHLRSCGNDRNGWFECDCCDFKTGSKGYMKKHQLYKHTSDNDVKWFRCDRCDFKSKQKSYFKFHLLRKHNFPLNNFAESFACDSCNYKGGTEKALKNHQMYMHSIVKSHSDVVIKQKRDIILKAIKFVNRDIIDSSGLNELEKEFN